MIRRGLVALVLLLAACESQQMPRITIPQWEQARESVTRIAREVLSNPIIEDYLVEIET